MKRIDVNAKKAILLALEFTKNNTYHINAGVCKNVSNNLVKYTNNTKDLVKSNEEWQRFTWAFLHKWSKSNRDRAYPIPGGIDTYEEHYEAGTLWVGEQRKLRLELIDFLTDRLEKLPIYEQSK